MSREGRSKLVRLLAWLPSGRPITSRELAEEGISADLAVHYVRSGWLRRIARGVFARPDAPLQRDPSLLLLEQSIPGLHVGGKTALDWHGVRHYVSVNQKLRLYGLRSARLPVWFIEAFPAEYHRKCLFRCDITNMKYTGPFEGRANSPRTSTPERAFLEMLSEAGVRQPIAEVRELAQSTYGLRASILEELLVECTSAKTVRLCVGLGRELCLPWAHKLHGLGLPRDPGATRARTVGSGSHAGNR